MNAIVKNIAGELTIGTLTTCQFGNPTDTSGYEGYAPVEIIGVTKCEITKRNYYLVKKVGENFVGRASMPVRQSVNPKYLEEGDDPEYSGVKGVLYCTSARSYGEGSRGAHLGFMTLGHSAHSLGFTL
jgi:hypothetical protein